MVKKTAKSRGAKSTQHSNSKSKNAAAAKPAKQAAKTAEPSAAQPANPSVRQLRAWHLTEQMARLLWQYKRLFIGIVLIYGGLNLILVQGLANAADIATLKLHLTQAFSGHLASFGSSLAGFIVVTSSGASGSAPGGGAYQFFLLIMVSLATIWTLRQLAAGSVPNRVRSAYYQGMSPLIPFILVLLVIGLQLLPLLIGSTLYSLVMNNGIAVGAGEKLFWTIILGLLAAISLYFVCSSLFALYIVATPDTTPMQALKAARKLVRRRRLIVLRTIVFLPLLLLFGAIIIMAPVVIWLTPLARWLFFALSILSIPVAHAYMYGLYQELSRE